MMLLKLSVYLLTTDDIFRTAIIELGYFFLNIISDRWDVVLI